MMRSGRLLAEESPDKLLAYYNLPSLEDVFLKLCMKDDVENRDEESTEIVAATSIDSSVTCRTSRRQQLPGSHVDLAFEHSTSQLDVSDTDIIARHQHRNSCREFSPASTADRFGVIKRIHLSFYASMTFIHNVI